MKKTIHLVRLTGEQVKIVHNALHMYRSVSESLKLINVKNLTPEEMVDSIEQCRRIFSDIIDTNNEKNENK